MTNLASRAFQNCVSLTNLVLPRSLKAFDASSFDGCTGLVQLEFEGDAPSLLSSSQLPANVTVFYHEGTVGWGSSFAGRPALLWTTYNQWAVNYHLLENYPHASGEQDDADGDGLTNLQEKMAGTNPTDNNSVLAFEATMRPNDLSFYDSLPIAENEFALFFQSVPGRCYDIESSEDLGGSWRTLKTVYASTKQTRAVFARPTGPAFYRLMIRQ